MEQSFGARCALTVWPLLRRPATAAAAVLGMFGGALVVAALAWSCSTANGPPLRVGAFPVSIAVDPATGSIYAADANAHTVMQLGRGSGQMLGVLSLHGQPLALALDARRHRLYIADSDARLTVVETQSLRVLAVLPAGSPRPAAAYLPPQIAADPNTGLAYVPDFQRDSVAVVADDQTLLAPLQAGHHPLAVALDPAAERLYIANAGDGSVSVIDARRGARIGSISVGGSPVALALDSAAGRLYVVDCLSAAVAVLDTATGQPIARVPVAPFPTAVALNPATHRVYVAHPEQDVVSVLAGGLPVVIATLPVGPHPVALAADATTQRVYVAGRASQNLTVLRDRPRGTPTILGRSLTDSLPVICADSCVEASQGSDEVPQNIDQP